MKAFLSVFLFCTLGASAWSQGYLTPFDFGLKPLDHGRIDYTQAPHNVLVGNFNSDSYPDIARFSGNKLEIFIFLGQGYSARPQGVRTFDQPIQSVRHDGFVWDGVDNLVVTLEDGTEETFYQRGGCLDLRENEGFLPQEEKIMPPRHVSEFDFEIVWESEPRPYGMNRCAVGDLDNDGINELVTWWKESQYADSAFFLVYKSVGDNQYELFMEEPFFTIEPVNALSYLLIADLDQNGQKELVYTLQYCYFWEFSAPGVYTDWTSSFTFARPVTDAKVSDVDQDGIPEIAMVGNHPSLTPPCAYQVNEFQAKSLPSQAYIFDQITCLYQEWTDALLDVGDFDNDGAVDIVCGWTGYLTGWEATWVQFYRYDSTNAYNFTQEWLYPGVYATCSAPVIADFDNDGDNELYVGGFGGYSSASNGSGSAYIWEATGLGAGYVAWWDTTTMIYAPARVALGIVDGIPCVLNAVSYWIDMQLYLLGRPDQQYTCLWTSPYMDSTSFFQPAFLDMDHDGRMNFIVGSKNSDFGMPNKEALDWEQVSVGINEDPVNIFPSAFQLHQNHPNPFNDVTIIPFAVSVKSDISLVIYDVMGHQVFNYKQAAVLPGSYEIEWKASSLSSGIYLVRFKSGHEKQVKKALLLK